ncbi:MAG: Cof-type HAD-IIB family hydrolase [Rikenellaceae bacterium]
MKNRIKIVVLDLDGTLTNSRKELSARNRQALIELQRRGVKVVLASGRPTYGIVPLAEELELKRYGGYILAYNGGVIIECSTEVSIYSNVLPEELISPLAEGARRHGVVILSYDGEYIVTEESQDKYVGVEAHLNKMKVKEVSNFESYFTTPLPKCLAVGDPEKVVALESELKGEFAEMMNIYRSEPFFLELVPLGIDKAHSLSILLDKIGDTKDSMIAFGDGFNDLSMIEYAGVGVAMSNAQDAVKSKADIVALSNDEDGVADFIERELL